MIQSDLKPEVPAPSPEDDVQPADPATREPYAVLWINGSEICLYEDNPAAVLHECCT